MPRGQFKSVRKREAYPIVGTPWVAIDLPGEHICIMDAADVPLIEKGTLVLRGRGSRGEAYVGVTFCIPTRRTEYLHRLLLGICGEGHGVVSDHINRDTMDNRRCNLRIATKSQNGANARAQGKTSALKGVYFYAGRWYANIGGSPQVMLGAFATELDAGRAYDRAAAERWGEFARLNFPLAA